MSHHIHDQETAANMSCRKMTVASATSMRAVQAGLASTSCRATGPPSLLHIHQLQKLMLQSSLHQCSERPDCHTLSAWYSQCGSGTNFIMSVPSIRET